MSSGGGSSSASTSGQTTGTTNCGDGVASGDEDCDGPDLNGQRCQDLGYEVGGTLACAESCSFDTTRCLGCGDSLPPATGACPPACDSCKGPRCLIQCPGNPACGSGTITCPAGWDCTVTCNGQDACKAKQIQCPDGLDCDVTCNQEDACMDAVVHCNRANCSLDCQSGVDVCAATTFNCGPNTGRATCGDGDVDFVFNDNNTACICTNVGCG